MANSKINVSDLDFDLIKTSLKTFLQGQSQFTDYDFEGSGLNVLLDVLAYNTHYNALYTNLAINEMFLDSASKRDSVISIANNYGYLPSSKIAAKATISMTVPVGSNTDTTLVLPKFSPFTSSVAGVTYSFYTTSDSIGVRNQSTSTYDFASIDIYEGTPVVERFNIIDNSKIILQNLNIDTTSIRVYIQDPASLNTTAYAYSENALTLDSLSEVYFVREVEGQRYQIYFGNDNLGKQPAIGSVVSVEYIVTSGNVANGLMLFTYSGPSFGNTPTIKVLATASGARNEETIDEIKYNVSHKHKVQDRAVTASDYSDIIRAKYPDIDSINCWGGETMTPPIYGKVYVCIKPHSSLFLTTSEKNYISEEIIKPKSMLGVSPVLIDPVYNSIYAEITVYYNPNNTNKSVAQIEQAVRQSVIDYNNTYLKKFDGVLRYSRLTRAIDDSDTSIINNITDLTLRRSLDVVFNISKSYTVELSNQVYQSGVAEEAILTTGFYINSSGTPHYIDDDGAGNLRLFYYNPLDYSKVFVNSKIGTVNYKTGTLKVNALFVSGLAESSFDFIVKTQSNDIVCKYNQITNIESSYLKINIIQEVNPALHKAASSRT